MDKTPIERPRSHGYLPHFDAPGFTQFVTFRLADTLPANMLEKLQFKLKNKLISQVEYYRQVEHALDVGRGPLYLKAADIAAIVQQSILHLSETRYELHAYVIMPNHVHILFTQKNGEKVAEIIHSLKSYTGRAANKLLARTGAFWSPDYFDRFIRNAAHFANAIRYIEQNPVKAGLCARPEDWRWSSAWNTTD